MDNTFNYPCVGKIGLLDDLKLINRTKSASQRIKVIMATEALKRFQDSFNKGYQ